MRTPVVTFLLLAVVFCTPPYWVILSAGSPQAIPDAVIAGVMWAPGFAAIVTRLLLQHDLRGFGWRVRSPKYVVVGYLVPALCGLVVYMAVWATGLGVFTTTGVAGHAGSLGRSLLNIMTAGFGVEIVLAFGEELGWRGLLAPELRRSMSLTRTGVLSGVIWVLFHVPAILFAGYRSAAPLWYGLVMFSLSLTAMSFILVWLREQSGSVWPAVALHASHNLFVQDVFDPMTRSGPLTQFVTSEFGVGLVIAYAIVAYVCWRSSRAQRFGTTAFHRVSPASSP
jgi:uncharacterized protein